MPDADEVTERSCTELDMEEKRREEPRAQVILILPRSVMASFAYSLATHRRARA